jgi:hypothetical protein
MNTPDIWEMHRQQLHSCLTNHSGSCPTDISARLPTRVIDVKAAEGSNNIHLHISAQGECAQYAALSYCWGNPPHNFVTTKNSIRDPFLLDWNDPPNTIRDAVLTTRALGLRYLWVDALCIIQDDPSDKNHEIQLMTEIYKNATITICAASSPSVHQGFLEPRDVPKLPLPIILSRGDYTNLWVRQLPAKFEEPIDTRGWTLQESLLSPRILCFGIKDVVWKCTKQPFGTAYPDTYRPEIMRRLPSRIFIPSSERNTLPEIDWRWIVQDYTARNLSVFNDRYRAIGGIARIISTATNDIHIAGIWKAQFVEGLSWFRMSNFDADDKTSLTKNYPKQTADDVSKSPT